MAVRDLAQVVVSFHGTIVDVAHLDDRKPEYRVGEAPNADFVIGSLPASLALVARRGGQIRVTVPPGFDCWDHAGVPIDAPEFALEQTRVCLRRGPLRIDIARVDAEPLLLARPHGDRRMIVSLLGHLLLAVVLFSLMTSTPTDPLVVQTQREQAAARLADYTANGDGATTRLPGPSDDPDHSERDEFIAGRASARAKHEVGARGSKSARSRSSAQLAGARPQAGAGLDRSSSPSAAAEQAGLLGLLAANEGFDAFAGQGSAFSVEQDDDAAMWASTTGLAHEGVGGLSLAGHGRGGGGLASGVAGLAHAGVLTKQGGSGSLTTAKAPAFGGRERRIPRTYICRLMIQGSIDRDIIRRIIRAHENEIRGCYNQALVANPTLAGRISVDFMITSVGKVGSVVISEDELHDAELGACVRQAVKHWTFPTPPDGGSSLISYGFNLRVD